MLVTLGTFFLNSNIPLLSKQSILRSDKSRPSLEFLCPPLANIPGYASAFDETKIHSITGPKILYVQKSSEIS